MTLKQEYINFLKDNFNGLEIAKPLFYNWNNGLRFDLQVEKTATDEYFIEVVRRATILFKETFNPTDNLFFVFIDYKYKRNKIRFQNYCFKQIQNLMKNEISYSKVWHLYEKSDRFDIRNIAITKVKAERLNFVNILTAIGHSDFPPRHPRLDKNGVLTNKEVYFINIDKKIIYNMYDDRGLDIVSADIKTLRPLYRTYKDWILDYDREKIDKRLKENEL